MSILSNMMGRPIIVERKGGHWKFHAMQRKGWKALSLEKLTDLGSSQRDATILIFPESLTLQRFLADENPELNQYREYVRIVRQFRHQGHALTLDEMLALVSHCFSKCEPETGAGTDWVKQELERDRGFLRTAVSTPNIFSYNSTASIRFRDVMATEVSKFVYAELLAEEDRLADVRTGVTKGGTPVRLYGFFDQSADILVRGDQDMDGYATFQFRGENESFAATGLIVDRKVHFNHPQDFEIMSRHGGLGTLLEESEKPRLPAADSRPNRARVGRVLPVDVIVADALA